MSVIAPPLSKVPIHYPESDGQPMADNTRQFRWIVTIQGGLDAVFRQDRNVFVAGNLLWYPVEGDNTICIAPDIFVVFGRPKHDRGSYLQWLEDNIAPQVAFEILSPGNRAGELLRKFKFFERYGVEEYYLYDPDDGSLSGWLRDRGELKEIPLMTDWISPRMKVKFELVHGDLQLQGPDGKRFSTYLELVQHWEQAQQRAELAQQRADRLAAKLKSLGIDFEDDN